MKPATKLMSAKLKPGDTVRVVGSQSTAKIRSILTASMHGAMLDKKVDGFRLWNLDELRLVKRGKAKKEKTDARTRRANSS